MIILGAEALDILGAEALSVLGAEAFILLRDTLLLRLLLTTTGSRLRTLPPAGM
jgi:hypothetical protein